MREFDFVKFTLWLALLLSAAAGAGWYWADGEYKQKQLSLRTLKNTKLINIGTYASDLEWLDGEAEKDTYNADGGSTAIYSYIQNCAANARIDQRDYTLSPRERRENERGGWADQKFQISGKKKLFRRENLFRFLYNIEYLSPKIKVIQLRLSLDEKQPEADGWKLDNATLLRREPMVTTTNPAP